MKEINAIGLDLAKNVFQVYGVDHSGRRTASRKLTRKQRRHHVTQLPACLIGIEVCSNSHYRARELIGLGHQVKMMAPKFVKPYVKGHKNDYNDAEAICEAVQRPNMRFVELKTPEQQAVLHLHKSRQRLIKERVGLSNHIRALLSKFGFVPAQGAKVFEGEVPTLLTDERNELPALSRQTLEIMWRSCQHHQQSMSELDKKLMIWHRENEVSCRLAEVPGIGVQTATALVATLGDGGTFRTGREIAAFIGLVPKQASSGGKEKLLGISKRGDGLSETSIGAGCQIGDSAIDSIGCFYLANGRCPCKRFLKGTFAPIKSKPDTISIFRHSLAQVSPGISTAFLFCCKPVPNIFYIS